MKVVCSIITLLPLQWQATDAQERYGFPRALMVKQEQTDQYLRGLQVQPSHAKPEGQSSSSSQTQAVHSEDKV